MSFYKLLVYLIFYSLYYKLAIKNNVYCVRILQIPSKPYLEKSRLFKVPGPNDQFVF